MSLKVILNPSLPPSCWDCRYVLLYTGYVTVMNTFLVAFPLACFQWISISNFKHKVNLHVHSLPKPVTFTLLQNASFPIAQPKWDSCYLQRKEWLTEERANNVSHASLFSSQHSVLHEHKVSPLFAAAPQYKHTDQDKTDGWIFFWWNNQMK